MIVQLLSEIAEYLYTADRQVVHDVIRYHRDRLCPGVKPSDIRTYREYVDGKQDVTFTDSQKELLAGVIGHEYCDNICAQIVGEAASRLLLLKWTSADEAVSTFLNDLYTKSYARMVSNRVHFDMVRDGNVGCSLSWSVRSNSVRMHREEWWDGQTGLFVLLDNENPEKIVMAVKEWQVYRGAESPNLWRRVVWIKGEIQRWVSEDGEAWSRYSLPEDVEAGRPWPIPWLDANGEPMDPPVVHFPNSGSTTADYGLSELSGGVIGAQDQLNDIQYTISAAARLTGYQMYTIAGMKKEYNDDGTEKPIEVGPGAILRSTSSDTKYGTLPAGDIGKLVEAYEHKIRTLARSARIPLHRLGQGNPPSGEALLRAESPAIGKAERQVEVCRARWADVAHMAMRLYNSFAVASPKVSEEPLITAYMEEPDRRDKISKSVIINNLGARISTREALRMMEYPDSEADRIIEELEQEAKRAAEILVAQAQASGGAPKGTPSPPKPKDDVKP